ATGEIARSRRAPEARRCAPEDRARECVLLARALVDAERGASVEGEELRGATEPLHEPEAPGRLAVGGLTMQRHRALFTISALVVLIASLAVTIHALRAAETPRRGGVMLAAIGADATSLDTHQEQTIAHIDQLFPIYC